MTKEKNQAKNDPGQFQISQKAIIYKPTTKEFLIAKGREDRPWDFIGGRLHAGEPLLDSLKREIEEEARGLSYEVVGVVDTALVTYAKLPITAVTLGYLITCSDQGAPVELSDEHVEFRWVQADNIEKSDEYLPTIKQFIATAVQKIASDEYLDDLKRLQADFENYKKRMASEQKETMRFITTGIISDLVPILDNFNMAVAHVPEDKKSDPWVTGITYIEKQFEEVIAGFGVSVMDVKVGDDFDPTRHEAVGSETKNEESGVENQDEAEEKEQKIAKVLQKGYLMGDKVIRAAKVVVS